MNQPQVYMCTPQPEPSSYFPPYPMPLGFPRALLWVPFFMHQTCTVDHNLDSNFIYILLVTQ